jgi:hypothetical protein
MFTATTDPAELLLLLPLPVVGVLVGDVDVAAGDVPDVAAGVAAGVVDDVRAAAPHTLSRALW